MARARKDTGLSPECREAFGRLTALAHRLSHVLTGDALSPDGKADTPRAQALVMAMLYFLIRTDPDDLEAVFFAERSLGAPSPGLPAPMRRPPLAALLD